jgi:hypothetical protein
MVASSPRRATGAQRLSAFSAAGAVLERFHNELSGSFVNPQGRLFITVSPLRRSSRRVTHHPERLPCSLLVQCQRRSRRQIVSHQSTGYAKQGGGGVN